MHKLHQNGHLTTLILAPIIIIAIVIVGMNVRTSVSKKSDRKYFAQLNTDLQNISNNITNNDKNTKTEQVNNCYFTEESGLFGKGNLWCFVNQAYYVKVADSKGADSAKDKLMTDLESEFQKVGFTGSVGPTSGYMKDSRSVCHFSSSYPSRQHVPYYLPEHQASDKELQLYFSCGARSSEKVFKYIP